MTDVCAARAALIACIVVEHADQSDDDLNEVFIGRKGKGAEFALFAQITIAARGRSP
jgi:hypothetical protein